MRLVPARKISGLLIDHKGRSVANADLRGYKGNEPDGRSTVGAKVDENGEFRVHCPANVTLKEMTYWVSDVALQPMKAEVLQEEPLVLQLEPPADGRDGDHNRRFASSLSAARLWRKCPSAGGSL